MSEKATIFHVKSRPYKNKEGIIVNYPSVRLHKHGTNLPTDGTEKGISIIDCKIAPDLASRLLNSPIPHEYECTFTFTQRNFAGKTETDVILQDAVLSTPK